MTKYYINKIQHVENILHFESLKFFSKEDENGELYFENIASYLWWERLASSIEVIDLYGDLYGINKNEVDDLHDYFSIAYEIMREDEE